MASFAPEMVDQTVLNECQHSITLFCWGRSIKISSDDPEAIAWFAGVYSRFIEINQSIVDISFFILSRPAHRRCPLLLVEGQMYDLPETACYVEHAELLLFRYLFEQLDDYIVLHAGVVTRQGRAIIIYGQSGFGKTTLTLELLRRGYGFMSDEFCPVRLSDCMVEPFERLVGLRKSSPFYSRLDLQRSLSLESQGKVYLDAADMFPYQTAQPCPPGIFIEIVGELDSNVCPPGGIALDIYMCRDSSSVPDALSCLPGVTISGPIMKGSYPVYRVRASERTGFVTRFNRIWQENSNDIFSVIPYRGEIDSYESLPKLCSVPAFEALTSLASNIVNRAPNGRLLAAHGGKVSSLVMVLGSALHNTSFYSLQPGQLDKMADIIDNI